jgi:hypothetical protein
MHARRAASFRFQMKCASGERDASGQDREPSSQGSNPCWSASKERCSLHSSQFALLRSRMRSEGQDVPARVQTVRRMPLAVIPKWEPVEDEDICGGVEWSGSEASIGGRVEVLLAGVEVMLGGTALGLREDMMMKMAMIKKKKTTTTKE